MPDPYHTLGLIYNAMGDKKKATNFYMIAARLTPKNASLWKLIIGLSKYVFSEFPIYLLISNFVIF